jgi:dephospho-CoA kinase
LKTFGITGGIGAGKSTVAELLRQLRVPTVDTDVVAREIVRPGCPALEEIRREFGSGVLEPDGSLNRNALAQIVFRDAWARGKLEGILHPRIHAVWQAEVEQWRRQGHPLGAVIIPLLFEKDLASHFELTVCVACSPETQRRRLLDRGWPPDQVRERLASQLPMRDKVSRSDRVLWNDGTIATLAAQLQRVLHTVDRSCPVTG